MSDKENRRSFIKKIVIGVATFEIGYLVYGALQSNSSSKSDKALFTAGKASVFQKGKMYPFNSGKFYLSVLEDGGMLALSIKCTHLGCMIEANSNGFDCPCHASAFDKFGEVLSPPATRALDIFPIKISRGQVFVDTNKPIKRKSYEKSQLTYV